MNRSFVSIIASGGGDSSAVTDSARLANTARSVRKTR
ncbi:hypothetical protein WDV93_14065 [Pantoea ananatis]